MALGLATRTEADPRAAALEMAAQIAARSPDAVRWGKRLLNMAGRVPLATGFAAEQTAFTELIGRPDQAEAVAATFERRAARFIDRRDGPRGSPTGPGRADEPDDQ